MRRLSLKHSWIFFPILWVVSCAPIKEDQCRLGDWRGLGVRDGTRGVFINYVNRYIDECAQYGVRVNINEWREGREQGLRSYCTVENAEDRGRRGARMNNVCGNDRDILSAYQHGQDYFEITEEIEELKDERDDIRRVIAEMRTRELSDNETRLLRRYLRRLDRIEDEINDLRRDLRLFRPYSG